MNVLAVRLDGAGDVLLTGPALRAVAAGADRVTMLVGPGGRDAARLLPEVDEVIEWACPWIDPHPAPLTPADLTALVHRIEALHCDQAVVFTTFHQDPLPTALVLRLAGVPYISATSEIYPGALLDVRHRLGDEPCHEVQATLALAAAAGFRLPPDDDASLRVREPLPDVRRLTGPAPYVVVHPGASVPARTIPPARGTDIVASLAAGGSRVVLTGSAAETAALGGGSGTVTARSGTGAVTARSGTGAANGAAPATLDLGGRTTLPQLAAVLAGADALVVGNTGPAHLAAAVGTPVVSLFAPVVPAHRWRPWRVPHVLLGDQMAPCAGTRARECPVDGHPCVDVDAAAVVAAVRGLAHVLLREAS